MPDMEKVINSIKACAHHPSHDCESCDYCKDHFWCFNDQLIEDFETMMQEQERQKGSWDYGTQCSVCKGTIIPPKDRKIRVNFCPWCGADMRDSYESKGR